MLALQNQANTAVSARASATAPRESAAGCVVADEVWAQALALRGHFAGMVRRRGVSHMDADDIIQDFSLRVVRSASSLRERDKLRPWLNRVLWSAFIDHLREQRGYHSAESAGRLVATAQRGSEPAPAEVDNAVHICMRAAIRQLKPEYAAAIERIDLASETAEQVAAAGGETVNNIRVRLFRARRALRARLVQQCRACPGNVRLDCTYASNIAEQRTSRA